MRQPILLALLGLALAGRLGAQTGLEANRYDETFRKYTRRFFGPAFDWRMFKAQAMTESRLDPAARSRAGARGLMQLMPTTFAEIQSRNPDLVSIDDPEWNVAAGIQYDRRLWRTWSGEVSREDQSNFMFASYNAGPTTIRTAQASARARALDHTRWENIEVVAPEVPRWRHRETLEYVRRIGENLGLLNDRGLVGRRR